MRASSNVLLAGQTIVNPTLTGTITGAKATLSRSGIPFIKLSSGSMGNNGALSGLTALPRTYSSGAYVWLPAGSIAAGVPASAAWYWCVFSSATAGTVYNSTYTSGTPAAGTLTAFATTGPGAFTGDTGTITAISVSVPAGSLGLNGRVDVAASMSFNNTAGNKVSAIKFGSTTLWTATLTTQLSVVATAFAANRGVANAQSTGFLYGVTTTQANGTHNATDGAENTANAVNVTVTLNSAVATDYDILEDYAIDISR